MINVSLLIHDDYSLALDLPDKVLYLELPKMNINKACDIAFLIATILEFTGLFVVELHTLSEDDVCKSYIADYKMKKEKGQLLLPITTAVQKNND